MGLDPVASTTARAKRDETLFAERRIRAHARQASSSIFLRDSGRMSVQTCSMYSRHSGLAPDCPTAFHPPVGGGPMATSSTAPRHSRRPHTRFGPHLLIFHD